MLPTVIILEPLSECMVIGACAAWAVRFLFGWEPLVFYLVHILAWFLCDWMLLSIVQVSITNELIYITRVNIIDFFFLYHKN